MKKINSLTIAAMALLMFSCSAEQNKNNGDQPLPSDGTNLTFSLKYVSPDGAETKNVEDGHQADINPEYTSVTVIAYADANKTTITNTFEYRDGTPSWDIVKDGKPLGIKVSKSAKYIDAYCNIKPEVGTGLVNSYQSFDKVAVTIPKLLDIITDSEKSPAPDGSELKPYILTCKLTPNMARVEVHGAINVDLATHRFYAIDVEGVYINNVYLKCPDYTTTPATGDLVFNKDENNISKWDEAYQEVAPAGKFAYMSDNIVADKGEYYAGTVGAEDHNFGIKKGKAAGYNIFTQKTDLTAKDAIAAVMPHIVVKVKAYLTQADFASKTFVADKRYITVRNFTDAGNNITNMQAAKIYRFDLNDLLPYFTEGTDPIDPRPEMDKVNVTLKAEIIKWSVVNMKPSL